MEDQRLVKTVTLGMVEGDRPRGRPPRRWCDDIADWCRCRIPEAVRLANDGEERRRITGLNGPHGRVLMKEEALSSYDYKHDGCRE